MRFDFTHFSALTSEELAAVENKVNEVILSACAVTSTEMPIEEAKKMGAMALFGEKYGDVVRVVKAGEFSTELCGGTHVDNAGKLGLFKIVSESSVASGVRRIEAVTGKGVVEYIASLNSLIANTARAMKLGNVNELERKAVAMAAELKEKEREIAALSAQLTDLKSADIFSAPEQIGAVKLIIARAEDMSADDIRSLGDKAKEQGDDVVAVIACVNNEKGSANIAVACGKAAVAAGANAGAIVRAVAQLAGGNGGGKPDFAMAGAKDLSKLDDAVAAANGIVSGMLK
jgi:alanyl-tRNA synthetase